MRHPSALDHPRALQVDRPGAEVVEQADAAPEQDRHQVDVDLVQESCPEALLHDAGGAHADVLVAGNRLRLLQGAFEAVGDEGERRSVIDPRWWDRAGHDKDRDIQGVVAAPPMGEIEGPAAEHQRPGGFAGLAEEVGGRAETLKTMSVPGSRYSVSPPPYQAKSRSPPSPMGAAGPSFGPLMNPSSETASPVRTFPMFDLLPIGLREVSGLQLGRRHARNGLKLEGRPRIDAGDITHRIRDQSSGLPPLTR